MKANRRWIIVGIIVIAIVIAWVAYPRLTASASATANLQTVPVQRGNIVATVSAAGNVTAPEDASLAFQTSGRVAKVNVQVGDQVKEGPTLMQLDTSDLELALQSAQANLADAQASYDASKTNLQVALQTAQANLASAQANYDSTKAKAGTNEDQLIVAKATLDNATAALQQAQAAYNQVASRPDIAMLPQATQLQQATNNYNSALANYKMTAATINNDALKQAQAQLDSAQAALNQAQHNMTTSTQAAQAQLKSAQVAVEQAQNNLAKATLVAPFSGVVAAVNYSAGDTVGAEPAVEIVNLSSLEVNATLSEIDVVKVKPGQTAQMTFDALPNKTYTATVAEVGPAGTITQGVVNYPVTLRVANTTGEIKPGMTANLNIDVAQADNVLMIPARAVHQQGNRKTVTVLSQGKEITVPIQTGLSNDQSVEVTQGLEQGEQVVLNPVQVSAPQFRGGFPGFGG
jgi:HlyD family secretion protein